MRLGSRALDILIALAQRPSELVSKEELISLVWPDTYVEEANLRVHIGALRRVLGDGRVGPRYISNIPGRGYSFVAPVERVDARQNAREPRRNNTQKISLPSPLTRIVGRSDSITRLADQLSERRFVTIVGPGGIGKTTVALAVAEQVANKYDHGAHFVDFARLSDSKLVAIALAEGLGVQEYADDPPQGVLTYLADKRVLILLDNCDHVIDAAAALAEAVVRAASYSHVLATSREPLRAAGESVHRLGPLPSPPPGAALTATEALAYPAAQHGRGQSCSERAHVHRSECPARAALRTPDYLGGPMRNLRSGMSAAPRCQ